MRSFILCSIFFLAGINYALAWDGFDYKSMNFVDVEPGSTLSPGSDIDYFDFGSGEYKSGTVEDISSTGSGVEIEVQEDITLQTRIFDMD